MNALTRREFLKVSAAAGGGLIIGFRFGGVGEAQAQGPAGSNMNAWVAIQPDGMVVLTCQRNEMGQDVHTSLAMLLMFYLVNHAGASRAAVITYVNPAVAALLGVWLLHEHLGLGGILAFALILLGSWLATRGAVESRRTAAAVV